MSYPVLEIEREADPDGQWIPFAVRMKLDLVGLKIHLRDWQALAAVDRVALLESPAETDEEIAAFEILLTRALAAADRPDPTAVRAEKRAAVHVWKDAGPISEPVASVLERLGYADAWPRLDRFGRYLVCSFAAKNDEVRLAAALRQLLDG